MTPTTYDGTTISGTQPVNYDNNEKDWNFQFDDGNKRIIGISYQSPKLGCLTQFNTYNPAYCKEVGKVTEKTNYIWDSLSTEYAQQAFTYTSRFFHRMCSMQVSKSVWWWYCVRVQAILWHGNVVRITDTSWGQSTIHQWIPLTPTSNAEAISVLCFWHERAVGVPVELLWWHGMPWYWYDMIVMNLNYIQTIVHIVRIFVSVWGLTQGLPTHILLSLDPVASIGLINHQISSCEMRVMQKHCGTSKQN